MGGNAVIFGMSIAEFENLSLTIGFVGLLCFLTFMLAQLARESKAGKYGTAWMYIGLGGGIIGFVGKSVIQSMLGVA